MTLRERYVSFEIAKILRKPGSTGLCPAYSDCFTTDNLHEGNELTNFNEIDPKIRDIVSAPTLQMACEWLRRIHKLEITPLHEMFQGNSWWYRIERNTSLSLITEYEEDAIFGSYEQACDEAIKYTLENLI